LRRASIVRDSRTNERNSDSAGVLRWAYWWNSTEGAPDTVTNEQVHFELNTDFSTKGLSAQEIQAIVAAWQANAISRDTMLDLFRRGEVLPEGRTNEEESRRVEAAPTLNPQQRLMIFSWRWTEFCSVIILSSTKLG
jgi:hypothetical protein